ncbi:FG-GAP-like repeat-containing protein [Aquiflexum sp.]|uniref:FG-GAP-like repeat-containing protein n=1 Tax=Aquiflexum sp. TaxID=1872584 RepID=UPI00359351DA
MLLLKNFWLVVEFFSKVILILPVLFIGFSDKRSDSEFQNQSKDNHFAWSSNFPNLGSLSSPRATDFNGDGILDIIVGMGRIEFQAADTAIVALDGKSGEIIWKRPAIDQIYGSAALLDINGDSVEDVVIGGRSAILQAIDGKNGTVIWDFVETNQLKKLVQKKYFNFYNSQLMPDITGDGLPEILVSNGGNVLKASYDPNRPAGKIIVIDSSNGKIIVEVETPDQKETYHSITLSNQNHIDDIEVVFGTGGETIGGNLYVVGLKDILNGDIKMARVLAGSKEKGFIAPAVWADLNGDGIDDIIANSVDGRVFAFDGQTKQTLWKVSLPGTEIYSSPAVGYFTNDQNLDVFVNANTGIWPLFSDCTNVMIDGANGKIKYKQQFGSFQSTSPLVLDINGDGVDEIIICENKSGTDRAGKKLFYNTISVVDFTKKGRKTALLPLLAGHNTSSTPWMGDLDKDNLLDIVFCHSNNMYHTYAFDGLQINLLKTNIPITKPLKWGAYMGSDYNGRY